MLELISHKVLLLANVGVGGSGMLLGIGGGGGARWSVTLIRERAGVLKSSELARVVPLAAGWLRDW